MMFWLMPAPGPSLTVPRPAAAAAAAAARSRLGDGAGACPAGGRQGARPAGAVVCIEACHAQNP